jgi:hypothetical protein
MKARILLGLLLCLLLLSVNSGEGASNGKQRSKHNGVTAAETGEQVTPPETTPKASPASGEQINRQVISAGGTSATSPNYILLGTAAQTATGQACGRSYCINHGYWQGGGTGPVYTCGDADGNTIVNISDAVYLISYIFGGGPAPLPLVAGDADCNSIVNIADAVYLIAYIFGGGAAPCADCP